MKYLQRIIYKRIIYKELFTKNYLQRNEMHIRSEYVIGHILILGLVLCLRICTKEKVGEKYHKGFFWLELICLIFLSSHFLYKMFTLEHQHCVYHHYCYGLGYDNLLHSDESGYETYNECSDGATFNYDIDNYEIEYLDEENPCEETEFGCCRLHTRCQNSIELNLTYDDYWDEYSDSFNSDNDKIGIIQLGFKKDDTEGSNCPTYDDIFELREWDEIHTPISFYLFVFYGVIIYFGIIIWMHNCSKDEQNFSPVDKEEVKQAASV